MPDLIVFFLCGSYEHHPVVEKALVFLLALDQTVGLSMVQNMNNPQPVTLTVESLTVENDKNAKNTYTDRSCHQESALPGKHVINRYLALWCLSVNYV